MGTSCLSNIDQDLLRATCQPFCNSKSYKAAFSETNDHHFRTMTGVSWRYSAMWTYSVDLHQRCCLTSLWCEATSSSWPIISRSPDLGESQHPGSAPFSSPFVGISRWISPCQVGNPMTFVSPWLPHRDASNARSSPSSSGALGDGTSDTSVPIQ